MGISSIIDRVKNPKEHRERSIDFDRIMRDIPRIRNLDDKINVNQRIEQFFEKYRNYDTYCTLKRELYLRSAKTGGID